MTGYDTLSLPRLRKALMKAGKGRARAQRRYILAFNLLHYYDNDESNEEDVEPGQEEEKVVEIPPRDGDEKHAGGGAAAGGTAGLAPQAPLSKKQFGELINKQPRDRLLRWAQLVNVPFSDDNSNKELKRVTCLAGKRDQAARASFVDTACWRASC